MVWFAILGAIVGALALWDIVHQRSFERYALGPWSPIVLTGRAVVAIVGVAILVIFCAMVFVPWALLFSALFN